MRGGLAAALSWLAGLGKADSFVPASEQSVKDIHNLLPAVAFDFLELSLTAPLTAPLATFGTTLGLRQQAARPDTFVTVSSGEST